VTPAYPLFFTYKDLIAGNGFFAGVICQGRALLTEEEEGFWMSGVNPGSIAGGGTEREAAFRAFKERYLSVLFDIASEACDFASFKAEVECFFESTNDPTAAEWENALHKVRNGELTLDLPKVEAAQNQPRIDVVLIERANPDANALDEISEAA